MNLQDQVLKGYPSAKKILSNPNCYFLEKKRYLVFWESLIAKASVNEILSFLQNETKDQSFSKWKTLIVVGKTDEHFEKKDLFYFDNNSTFVVFLLLNEKNKNVFMNDSWIFVLGCNFNKHVRKISKIIQQTANIQ